MNNNNIGKSKYGLFKNDVLKEYIVRKNNYIVIDNNEDSDGNYSDNEQSIIFDKKYKDRINKLYNKIKKKWR